MKIPEIEFDDDKKEKWQSVTASCKISNFESSYGWHSFELEGYGENEEEAKKNLLDQKEQLIKILQEIK